MNNNKIEVLTDREHVLRRPGMYIGSTKKNTNIRYVFEDEKIVKKEIEFVPALLKMFDEIISNSIDEFIRTEGKHANKIDITVLDNRITVVDNGRGINHEIETKTGIPQSVIAFTKLKAGANFNDDTFTLGQNGVGAACVAIFSREFEVITCNGIAKTHLLLKENCMNEHYKITKNSGKTLTSISFIPDFRNFSLEAMDDVHFGLIKKRIIDLSMCYPDIAFTFNKEKVITKRFKDYVSYYGENTEIFSFKNLDVAVLPSEEPDVVSFVNGITTKDGQHIEVIAGGITWHIRDKMKKKFQNIKPSEIRGKLLFIINLKNLQAPRFDGQTKEILINPQADIKEAIKDVDWPTIGWKINRNKPIINPILDIYAIQEEMKKRQKVADVERKISKVKIAKFRDCISEDKKNCTLYLCEGDSAIGRMLECRGDDETIAGYPLRGKFLNVFHMEPNIVIKNQEVQDLLNILNLKLSSDSIEDMTFGRIAILGDQDYDGDCISCQLINFFYKYWPNIIKENRLFRVCSPLVVAKEKATKQTKVFYSMDDFNLVNNIGQYEVLEYNKGLGSLTLKAYKEMLLNPVMIQVQDCEESPMALEVAFSWDAEKRKVWLAKN